MIIICSIRKSYGALTVRTHVSRLGFQYLPGSIPGRGPLAVQEAQRLTQCDRLKIVPCESGGSHWEAVMVGLNEIMTPCISKDFYGMI